MDENITLLLFRKGSFDPCYFYRFYCNPSDFFKNPTPPLLELKIQICCCMLWYTWTLFQKEINIKFYWKSKFAAVNFKSPKLEILSNNIWSHCRGCPFLFRLVDWKLFWWLPITAFLEVHFYLFSTALKCMWNPLLSLKSATIKMWVFSLLCCCFVSSSSNGLQQSLICSSLCPSAPEYSAHMCKCHVFTEFWLNNARFGGEKNECNLWIELAVPPD